MARTHLGFTILAGLSLSSGFIAREAAAEGPRTLFGAPVNDPPAMTEQEIAERAAALPELLDAGGLVMVGKTIMPKRALTDDPYIPPGLPAWDTPPHRTTIFLNFFGGPMKNGTNASEMESPCVPFNGVNYPGYNDTEQKALAIIQVFKDAAEPFGVRIAYEKAPPKHLPYSQVMMGGKPGIIGLPNGVLGVACNLDCGDVWWRDTTFAFTEAANDVGVLGTTALQEAAHAWGLDHIDGENNIMYPYATFGTKVWADSCTKYNPATGDIGCEYVHDEFCGEDGGAQNDVAELMAFFGANSPDTIAPTVVMKSPADGSVWDPGATISVAVEVSDDHLGYGWRLMVPELDQEIPVYDKTKNWDLKPPNGTYTIRVEAIDHDRNVGFAEAKIYVGVEPTPEPETTGGEEGDDTSNSASDASDAGDEGDEGGAPTTGVAGEDDGGDEDDDSGDVDTTPISTGSIDDDKGDGCSCRSDRAASLWLLAPLVLIGARRRRR